MHCMANARHTTQNRSSFKDLTGGRDVKEELVVVVKNIEENVRSITLPGA